MLFAKRKISNLSSRDERVKLAIKTFKILQNDYIIEKIKNFFYYFRSNFFLLFY